MDDTRCGRRREWGKEKERIRKGQGVRSEKDGKKEPRDARRVLLFGLGKKKRRIRYFYGQRGNPIISDDGETTR